MSGNLITHSAACILHFPVYYILLIAFVYSILLILDHHQCGKHIVTHEAMLYMQHVSQEYFTFLFTTENKLFIHTYTFILSLKLLLLFLLHFIIYICIV